ncbi:hypothetical protein PDJ82_25320 [Bacillus cereus group sp. TH43LC]|uniref:Uncharacterized protein n=5 Tax=Bacteria TaxID=2 RepID=A0A5M9GT75_9BACI|nr:MULTISPECIES: hypothetical protein [Bacillus]ACJ77164.1 hypothetical protein BCAH187_A4014 [Bacillus cereus AH187]EEK99112.1 hypothetical protein bcere0013_37210 [Bacillus cereus BDRD-ST26]EJP97235.1 hypothetical protein IAU_01741 [Bacillus cereus IS075]EJQ03070.1 hypothetical protein IC5_02966 [Bacillus cereus AND1407]EJR21308.1 hypothetical protein II7_00363 [Bacillus cereus MSX-A12]EJR42177.1 hypothetical protein IIK_05680 [Bacillus cereus VD102]EOO96558.1 hypothetical protein IGQ_0227
MYFIDKEEDLIGKEIAFTHMAQFAEAITIVTKDKGIFVVEQWREDDHSEIHAYSKGNARAYILKKDWLRKTLHEKGIISHEEIEEYENQRRLEQQKQQEEYKRKREEQEKITYERLKAKFEVPKN